MEPLPTRQEIERGDYRKWDGNTLFDKECLRALGLPEDFWPTREQAYLITVVALED